MSVTQNSASSHPGTPGASPWAMLNRLLTGAVGPVRAGELLSSALVASRLLVPPMSKRDVLRFVETHLSSTLGVSIGDAWALSFVEGFSTQLQECMDETPDVLPCEAWRGASASAAPSGPPPLQSMFRKRQPSISGEEGRPIALIALSDPLERSWLARTLVTEGLDVRSSETIHELLEILRDPAVLRVAVVDAERADLLPVLRSIMGLRPALPLVVWTNDAERAKARMRPSGLRLVGVYEKRSAQHELVACIVQHASEALASGDE